MGRACLSHRGDRKRQHHPARAREDSEHPAILFNCKTTLVDTFRERFPDQFEYRQTRALLLPLSGALPKQELTVCLSLALTYHLDRRRRK